MKAKVSSSGPSSGQEKAGPPPNQEGKGCCFFVLCSGLYRLELKYKIGIFDNGLGVNSFWGLG